MSRNRRNYQNLWIVNNSKSAKVNSNIIAAINCLDEETDIATSIDQYTTLITEGMVQLIQKGLVRSDLIQNEKFFEKLMDLGKSIMNGAKDSKDTFVLGLLVDGQISKKFLNLKFYKLILRSLELIRNKCKLFTQAFIEKLENTIAKAKNSNNLDYFYHYRKTS